MSSENITYDVPINGVSFGQVALNLLRVEFANGNLPPVFPRGGTCQTGSLGVSKNCSQENLDNFNSNLGFCTKNGISNHSRINVAAKLWHINGLQESFCKRQIAITFHETSSVTETERDILSEQDAVIVTSKYTKSVFEKAGLENIHYAPLGIDRWSFYKSPQPLPEEGVTTFGLSGKLETRKHTLKVLRAWAEEFGNNDKFRLNCTIFNPHLKAEDQNSIIHNALQGQRYFNINLIPRQESNSVYNSVLNSVDIDLTGMSGCEGFNLPLFQSLALGKHAVVLNAHVHKDFCNNENSVLVEPSSFVEAHDGIFFNKGGQFNQGEWFDFHPDNLKAGMHKAIERFNKKAVNTEGEKLSEQNYSELNRKIHEIANMI